MTRQVWSWSSARRLFRLPGWGVALAAAFLLGTVAGPLAVSAGPASSSSGGAQQARGAPQWHHPYMDHVFVIMLENTSYHVLLSPSNRHTRYIQSLAQNNGLATHYFGVTHTSLPDYMAATSGQTWGSNDDDTAQAPDFNHQNLVDQFEAAHVSWKAYMQSLPYPGDLVDETHNGLYVRKHDPFLMYPDVYQNPARAANVVPLTQLRTDLASGKVPQYAWITPNICNDMHGGAPTCPYPSTPTDPNQVRLYKNANGFLRTWVGLITHSSAWTGHSAIFITWDEGSYADTSPFGPLDNRGGPGLPHPAPRRPPDPHHTGTAAATALFGGTPSTEAAISR